MTPYPVEIPYSADLAAALAALAVPHALGRPTNGARGSLQVTLDPHTDRRLQDLIDDLAALRWRYEPGRTLQIALPGLDDSAQDKVEDPRRPPLGGRQGAE
jgi:hypothetical protein